MDARTLNRYKYADGTQGYSINPNDKGLQQNTARPREIAMCCSIWHNLTDLEVVRSAAPPPILALNAAVRSILKVLIVRRENTVI